MLFFGSGMVSNAERLYASRPMNPITHWASGLALLIPALCAAQTEAAPEIEQVTPAEDVDLAGSFTFRMHVRMPQAPPTLPMLAGNKAWESGEVRDYTTNNSYGLGRESGVSAGFAISVLPDGAWMWNAGDGRSQINHRPEAADQDIADGQWHEVGFVIDREQGVAHLFHDGRRVAVHDLQGVGSLKSGQNGIAVCTDLAGVEIKAVRTVSGITTRSAIASDFTEQFGEDRKPAPLPEWDGRPLRVLAWNIWQWRPPQGTRRGRPASR